MKIKTRVNIGQKEYQIDGDILGIKAVRINGRKVNAEFLIILPTKPRKSADLILEIEKVVVKEK